MSDIKKEIQKEFAQQKLNETVKSLAVSEQAANDILQSCSLQELADGSFAFTLDGKAHSVEGFKMALEESRPSYVGDNSHNNNDTGSELQPIPRKADGNLDMAAFREMRKANNVEKPLSKMDKFRASRKDLYNDFNRIVNGDK